MTLPTTQGSAALLGSRCSSCTSPLAADQLFCLQCGTRRRDARIPFRDVLATEAAPVVPLGSVAGGGGGWGPSAPGVISAGGGRPPGASAYAPFIGMLACLLLALGVGVWIGRGQDSPVVSAAPIAAAPVAAVVATTPAADTTATDASDASSTGSDSSGTAAAKNEKPVVAPTPSAAVKNLDKLSPKDYQKQSTKLPKEVGTGGTAPPKDNKPAGAGSETQTFQ